MKARPRRAENRVAEELSKWFVSLGLSPIERKPVIGRTGPDYTFNELKLVIDEKSRLSVPKAYAHGYTEPAITRFYGRPILLGTQIESVDRLLAPDEPKRHQFPSSQVYYWYEHMKEWQVSNMPDGITALVLHRPGMHFRNATFIISEDDRKVLRERVSSLRKS